MNNNLGISYYDVYEAEVMPINMEEGIFRERTIFKRINIVTGKRLFETKVRDILSDARVTIEKTKEVGNEWYYKIHITNYDGTKEEREIQLNIETGEINQEKI